ncbi:MAG: helix-turn-helix domain-containing protein [Anaerolineae bacterium]|nr:helix-turn-helix domain-containing protein [Anaerolineae bacterium]
MDKLGRRLRQAREAQGSTLEEAEAGTHIRAHFLKLLEAGDFAAFAGGDVQVRGFLSIYARYLDLSVEDVLGHYMVEVHGEDLAVAEAAPEEAKSQAVEPADDLTVIRFRPRNIPVNSSLPRWMSVKTVMIVGLVLTVLLAILAVATYVMNQPDNARLLTPLVTTTTIAEIDTPTATPATEQTTPTSPVSTSEEVTLAVEATEHVQVRVRQGSEIVFEDRMVPSQTEMWTDDELIVLETGNGAALQVTVNGTALGTMGERGELCTRAWGPSGEVTPP